MIESQVGATIRRLREERELSLSKLARMCDMPNSTLIKIESGLASPRVETIERIAEQLEVEPYELLKPQVAHLPAKRRSKPQRGAMAIGAILRMAVFLSAMLLLPGIAKAAAPIIHHRTPVVIGRSSPRLGRVRGSRPA